MTQIKVVRFHKGGDPLPHQAEVYERTLDHNSVCLLGAVGSGKSSCIVTVGIREALAFAGNQIMFIRRTLQELNETTHQTFLEEIAGANAEDLIIRRQRDDSGGMNYWIRPIEWDGKESSLSLIQFRSATHAGRQDPDKFKSLNLGCVGLEEISEIEEPIMLMLLSRLRRHHSRRLLVAATNPPYPDHWITKYWNLDKTGEGKKPGYYLVKSKTRDNIHLPPDYINRLLEQWPASWVHRYVEGNVGFLIEGDPVFEQLFRHSLHVSTFDPDPRVPLVRSWDIGYGRVPAVSWHQFVPDPSMPFGLRWDVLDEYMWPNPPTLDDFYIKALAQQRELFGLSWESRDVYDPAGAAVDVQTGKSALDALRTILQQYGIGGDYLCAADRVRNSTLYRIGLVQSWLKLLPDGRPRLRIHERCQTIIGGFQGGYQYAKDRSTGEKLPSPIKNHYSHLMDTAQYAGVNVLDFDKMIVNPKVEKPSKVPSYDDSMMTVRYARKVQQRVKQRVF